MRFLAKDVNRSLLVLIAFFLVLFIAFTVYYEVSLKKAVSQKRDYDEKTSMITAQLIVQKLNRSNSVQEIALMDKAVLEHKYNELAAEKEKLEAEKKELKEEITLLKSEIEYQKVKIDGPVAQFRLIQEKNQLIRQLNEKIAELCAYLRRDNISVDKCQQH